MYIIEKAGGGNMVLLKQWVLQIPHCSLGERKERGEEEVSKRGISAQDLRSVDSSKSSRAGT